MRAVIQRVSQASVEVIGEDGGSTRSIGPGFAILLGIGGTDEKEDADWLIRKILALRIFEDTNGRISLDLDRIQAHVLVISQFTLLASTKKGNRPSFDAAARPEKARPLYEYFVSRMKDSLGADRVQTGKFGARMRLSVVNEGPFTILMDSKLKE